jgi:hypothetical protein
MTVARFLSWPQFGVIFLESLRNTMPGMVIYVSRCKMVGKCLSRESVTRPPSYDFKKIALLTIILLTGVIRRRTVYSRSHGCWLAKDHPRPYGVSWWYSLKGTKVKWFAFNYRGGSFSCLMLPKSRRTYLRRELWGTGRWRGERVTSLIAPSQNMQEVIAAPKIAVYTPTGKKLHGMMRLPWF